MEKQPKCYETLPPNYYDKRARQHVNYPLHFIGRKVLSGFLKHEQGQGLTVAAPQSVHDYVETGKPLLVSATHRSWMDIAMFVEATQEVGIKFTRPLSKIENIQKSRALAWFFHQVGLFAAVREDPDMEGIDKVFTAASERKQNTLVFHEGTRVLEDIEHVNSYARTPAMMAMTHGFAIVHLAMVGGGVGETIDSKHVFKGKRLPVADAPLALFGDVIELEYDPNAPLVRQAGIATRSILKPDLQSTLDAAYVMRAEMLEARAS
jgi:1-acyl-sn-glycerol-3-phosphate acyltransferase